MPILLCPLCIAGLLAAARFHRGGWSRWASLLTLALLALPVLIAGVGGFLLAEADLAWRSGVKMACGLGYTGGILLLLVWAGAFLWRQVPEDRWNELVSCFCRLAIILAVGFLCTVLAFWGIFCTGMWAGEDLVTEQDGQTVVMESAWIDYVCYPYHGPLVRGRTAISWSH